MKRALLSVSNSNESIKHRVEAKPTRKRGSGVEAKKNYEKSCVVGMLFALELKIPLRESYVTVYAIWICLYMECTHNNSIFVFRRKNQQTIDV